MPAFEEGTLKPLPLRAYSAGEVIDVFRMMAQGRHTGKLVIAQEPEPFAVREQATYLITGGLGGLGLAVAEWLAQEGACHIVLVGRSAPQEQAQAVLQKLRESGVEVNVLQTDVSRREALEEVFARIHASMPPLKGVFHAAGALDDGILTQQTWERFSRVYASKVQGSWHLHELTRGMALDFFVLFSSAVSLLGSAGQANHVAACTFQDMLAQYRRSQGLPALSIGWGPWAQIGAAAEREVSDRLLNRGIETIPPAQGIESLAKVIRAPRLTHIGVVPVNWTRFMSQSAAPFFTEMQQQVKAQSVRAVTLASQPKDQNEL
jgi:myxalamid-type polyketide synthase MxaB